MRFVSDWRVSEMELGRAAVMASPSPLTAGGPCLLEEVGVAEEMRDVASDGAAAVSDGEAALLVNPLALIQECLSQSVECSLQSVDGELCVAFPLRNCCVSASAPSGLTNRKKDPYTMGDVWRLLFTPKEQYVFNYVLKTGNKYINVLERPRLSNAIRAIPPLPPPKKLPEPQNFAAVAAAAALAAREEATEKGELELVNSVLNNLVPVKPLDPTLPVDLPGAAETESFSSPSEQGASRKRKQTSSAWLLPVGLEGEAEFHAWKGMLSSRVPVDINTETPSSEVKHPDSSSSSSCSNRVEREKAFALRVLRMQRPLVQRSVPVLTQGLFTEVLESLRSIVATKRARKPLDVFSYKPRPGVASSEGGKSQRSDFEADGRTHSSSGAVVSSSTVRQHQKHSMPSSSHVSSMARRRHDAFSSKAMAATRNSLQARPSSASRLCVIDEICSKRRRRPIILVPSLAASGGVACLLTSCNARALLQEGKFISARDAQREAAAQGTAIGKEGVIITHRIRHHDIQFNVVECTYASKYRRQDWECVVAVVVNASSAAAAQWQFHKWPFKDFTDLFLFYKGFVFAFEEEAIPAEVTQWNTTVLRLSRSRRYNDEAAAGDFWRYLSEFLLNPRPNLIVDGGCLTPGASRA